MRIIRGISIIKKPENQRATARGCISCRYHVVIDNEGQGSRPGTTSRFCQFSFDFNRLPKQHKGTRCDNYVIEAQL